MRILRIFFVAAQAWSQFPVDILLPAREHVVQSLPRALQKRVTHIVTPSLTPTFATPLEYAVTKNASANPLECAVAKSLDLKFLGMNTYKKGVGGCRILICSSLLKKCFFSVIPGEATNLPFGKPREREIPRRLRLLGMTASASLQLAAKVHTKRFTARRRCEQVAAL